MQNISLALFFPEANFTHIKTKDWQLIWMMFPHVEVLKLMMQLLKKMDTKNRQQNSFSPCISLRKLVKPFLFVGTKIPDRSCHNFCTEGKQWCSTDGRTK